MDEMKPCPFCGCTTILVHERTCNRDTPYNPNDRAAPTVRCGGCYASVFGQDWTGPDTAITVWNTRPREDAGVVDEAMARRALMAFRQEEVNQLGNPTTPYNGARIACMKTALAAALGKSNG